LRKLIEEYPQLLIDVTIAPSFGLVY